MLEMAGGSQCGSELAEQLEARRLRLGKKIGSSTEEVDGRGRVPAFPGLDTRAAKPGTRVVREALRPASGEPDLGSVRRCLLEVMPDELVRLAVGVEPVGEPFVELSARLL